MTEVTTITFSGEWLSVQEGKDTKLNFAAFSDAPHDLESGLTYAALMGKRKQSHKNAECLFSYYMADSLRRKGHVQEADHVKEGQMKRVFHSCNARITIIRCWIMC